MKRLLVDIDFDSIRRIRAEQRAELIAQHGWDADVDCPRCGDHGIPPGQRMLCTCQHGERLAVLESKKEIWQGRIPRRCWEFTLDSAPDQHAAGLVRDWLISNPFESSINLIISGEPGTGKTGLAIGALRAVHDGTDRSVGFINVPDYLDCLRPTEFAEQRVRGEQLRRRAERASLLVIDDLGAEKSSEWVAAQMYHIVNSRYEHGKPMIITTNATRKELSDAYGDRVVDRIVERSSRINMDGANLRRR